MTTLSEADTGQHAGSDEARQGSELNHAPSRRESAILITLSLVGIAIEFPLGHLLRVSKHSEITSRVAVVAIMIGLTSMVPFAVALNSSLGLPGAPLIVAKIAGKKSHFRIRSLLKISAGYAFLALLVSGAAIALVLVFLFMAHPNMKLPTSSMTKIAPGRIAIVGALVSIAAGVCEEIQFRLVLFAIFGWILRRVTGGSSGPSSRSALWFATILQAYAFGMLHLFRLAALPQVGPMLRSVPSILVAGLLVPQTWAGIVLGRLYLKRGLEACMIAHAMMDGALAELLAVLMLLVGLLQTAR